LLKGWGDSRNAVPFIVYSAAFGHFAEHPLAAVNDEAFAAGWDRATADLYP
jgi:hypothetical protein